MRSLCGKHCDDYYDDDDGNSVRLFVCLSVTLVSPVKTAEHTFKHLPLGSRHHDESPTWSHSTETSNTAEGFIRQINDVH